MTDPFLCMLHSAWRSQIDYMQISDDFKMKLAAFNVVTTPVLVACSVLQVQKLGLVI